ncbi:class I SAM-dependent methyltransferase [Nitrogeniibacter mangrovi]|uniref:Class I SAM-dependent methyltransferase n=1 Tax=Nitrogeniibacter mangrovi TaxID=2016596 RepID=A0A6C1B0Z3_9RHOO|nr:SAM-dependent methyltransferase [Nitrogeniibacter mangrovi]QID16498.1 class I SAM-dependent methyltransferase [Nitrogeniibacter mangrovi]
MTLPQPGPDALAQSDALAARLRARIDAADGWIGFADYMHDALYTPGLGYYSGGAQKFGPGGDFITAPELTPLFGQALAAQVAEITAQSASEVLEVGAGTGLLAADLLLELDRLGHRPERYSILEVSGELRERQAATLASRAPALVDCVRWIDTLPERFRGAVVANEVLDVMPVHLLVWRDGAVFERGVAVDADGHFAWADRPAGARLLAAAERLGAPMPAEGEYVSELNLAGEAWMADWGTRLEQGALLMIDYGYPRAEYYLPSRSNGTLLCYYRHQAHADPFRWPGLNDITAFVDFTAMAEAAHGAGLDIYGYTAQAAFLFNCGILERLAERGEQTTPDYIRAARAVQRLTTPQEMGELFKVLAAGKGLGAPLLGFARSDRLHTL